MDFHFQRIMRTPYSEVYAIFENNSEDQEQGSSNDSDNPNPLAGVIGNTNLEK